MTPTTAVGGGAEGQRAIAAFKRHAFAALLAGETPRLAEVTEAASRDTLGVAQAVAWLDAPVLWMPVGPCERVIDDFCPYANLFCSRDHIDAWRHTAGDPTGHVVTLAEIPALARTAWADVATPG
jgi:hypothetical protein